MTVTLQQDLETWPNCPTRGCKYKINRWAGEGRCTPHTLRLIGKDELDRRYAATHDAHRQWTGAVALIAADQAVADAFNQRRANLKSSVADTEVAP